MFLQDSEAAQRVLGGIGLILIGACLGEVIPLSVEAIARVMGRDTLLVGDAGINGKHTTIFKGRDGFSVRNISKNDFPIWVGDVQLAPGMADHRLQSDAEIVLGQTRVQFREG